MASYFCQKCGRTMDEKQFYTYKNGEKAELCKPCMTMHIDNFDSNTFLWLLEKFDVPYIEGEWNVLRDKAYARDPLKMNGMSVFGKYLSKMKLKQWNKYSWADTETLKQEAEKKAEDRKKAAEAQAEYLKNQLENGAITEAEYKTLVTTAEQNKQQIISPAPVPVPAEVMNSGFYNENNFISEDDLPDFSKELTDDDKIMLALKWGRLYKPAEWIQLEQQYNDFISTFDIQGAARIDTLKFICKTSLKMHQALDSGDYESYQKLARVYDAQMKSAKFTEAQKKTEEQRQFSCYGEIVAFCELNNDEDYIRPINLDIERDVVDKDIKIMKNWTKELIEDDPAIYKMIEMYIRKRESLAQAEADQEGLDVGEYYELTDQDMQDYRDYEDAQRELDEEES